MAVLEAVLSKYGPLGDLRLAPAELRMRSKHDVLRDAVTAAHRAHQQASDDEVKEHLDDALHLLLLIQAFEEADGDHQETLRGAIEHAPGASRE